MEYKIVKRGNYVEAKVRNGKAWIVVYSGYSSEGRDMEAHFSAVLESKGYAK